jgi:DNA-binding beta-propeller fold protein YncE
MKPVSPLIAIGVSIAAASCARDLPGEDPPADAFYFPLSLAAAPDGRHVYVVSSNFDLRYNAGWVTTLDLEGVTSGGAAFAGDELRVLSLAGQIAVAGSGTMAAIAHRGAAALSLLELDGASISCGDAAAEQGLSNVEQRTDCDSAHILELDAGEFDGDLLDVAVEDPYAVALTAYDDGGEPRPVAVVAHLLPDPVVSRARLTTFEITSGWQAGETPVLEAASSLVLANSGVSSLVVHPDLAGTHIAATSRGIGGSTGVDSALYSVDVGRSLADQRSRVEYYDLSRWIGGYEVAGLTFSPDGRLAFATNRGREADGRPLAEGVVVLDATLETVEEVDSDGQIRRVERPRYFVLGQAPVPGRPTAVEYVARAEGEDLVAVASFDEDEVTFFAVRGTELFPVGRLDDVGGGPFDMLHASYGGHELLLVSTFFDHAVAVYDLTPAEPVFFSHLATLASSETDPVPRGQ